MTDYDNPTVPTLPQPDFDAGHVVLERYRLTDQLGAGGMGTVWRARDLLLGRDIAVKIMAIGEPLARARFLREGKLAALLDHRGLCKIFDVGQNGDQGYLVMEMLSGTTLYHRNEAGLDLSPAMAITADVARAMDHAHAAGLVHRDLKPDNVFLDSKSGPERVVVIDFGLAFSIDGDPLIGRLTRADVTGGTPAYMSPEQARAGELTQASDVYALGCILFELCAGRPPFEGTPALMMSKHVYTAPPTLAALVPGIPQGISMLVSRMLQKAPADRPSMAEVADECDRIVHHLSGGAWHPPAGFGRGKVNEARDHRMVTRNESSQAAPDGPATGTIAIFGTFSDEVMVALAATGMASVRIDTIAATTADLVIVDASSSVVAQFIATGQPVIATVDLGDLDGAMAMARLGAIDVLTRPIQADSAARKIERGLRRAKVRRT